MSKRPIDRDDERVGINIRTWLAQRNAQRNQVRQRSREGRGKDPIQWIHLAELLTIHKATLSRKLSGSERFTEAQLLAIAQALGIHAGHFLVDVGARSRWPGIPPVTIRGKAADRYGRSIKSIESVIKDPTMLKQFIGEIPDTELPLFTQYFIAIRDKARALRQAEARNPVQT